MNIFEYNRNVLVVCNEKVVGECKINLHNYAWYSFPIIELHFNYKMQIIFGNNTNDIY